MYSTCLYCTKDLGRNEVIETLPIGRRVAFDAAQGRLWVVCRSCGKWNLVPFDTRLETIDACEQLFRSTRTRFSTDHIGIARLREGLELVRIGPALRPEFAAWRYGDQFGRRRVSAAVQGGALAVGMGAMILGGHALRAAGIPVVVGIPIGFAPQVFQYGVLAFQRHRVSVRNPGPEGVGGVMTAFDVRKSVIVWDDDGRWSARVPMRAMVRGPFISPLNRPVETEFHPDDAVGVLGRIMPKLNGWGGSKRTVRDAVELMGSERALDGVVRRAVGQAPGRTGVVNDRWRPFVADSGGEMTLKSLDHTTRLALEMSAHEETERKALQGELKLLERQWKEAEELAKITDSLTFSADADAELARRKGLPPSK